MKTDEDIWADWCGLPPQCTQTMASFKKSIIGFYKKAYKEGREGI